MTVERTPHEPWHEPLSRLVDGDLSAVELDQLWAQSGDRDEMVTVWRSYHRVGEALRAPAAGAGSGCGVDLDALRSRLAAEPPWSQVTLPDALTPAPLAPSLMAHDHGSAANDRVFRWQMVAGIASLTVVALAALNFSSSAPPASERMARNLPVPVPLVGSAPGVLARSDAAPAQPREEPDALRMAGARGLSAVPDGAQGVMLRDPHLDALLAAHRQNAGATLMQNASGFLRNATFNPETRCASC